MLANSGPEILTMDELMFEPYWALNFHHSTHHELLYVIDGKFTLTLENGDSFNAVAGDTLIIPADTVHKDVFDLNDELKIFIIHFHWEMLADYLKTVTLDNINIVDSAVKYELKVIFDSLRLDPGYGELDREISGARLLTVLLLILKGVRSFDIDDGQKNISARRRTKQKLLVNAAKRYIDNNYQEPLQLIDVAEHLQLSPFYLSRLFASESNFSLVEYLTEVRIKAAKKLLKSGQYIIADIATLVGYHDGSYFSKVFKRVVGCSPTVYTNK